MPVPFTIQPSSYYPRSAIHLSYSLSLEIFNDGSMALLDADGMSLWMAWGCKFNFGALPSQNLVQALLISWHIPPQTHLGQNKALDVASMSTFYCFYKQAILFQATHHNLNISLLLNLLSDSDLPLFLQLCLLCTCWRHGNHIEWQIYWTSHYVTNLHTHN